MTLLEQARKFREIFNQEILENISRFGFIKKGLWDMQLRLIAEEGQEFMTAADECFADPENVNRRRACQGIIRPCLCLLSICCYLWYRFG